jgi:hypothetical protein
VELNSFISRGPVQQPDQGILLGLVRRFANTRKNRAIMKSVLSLFLILLIVQLGAVARAETPIIQPTQDSCGDSLSQIDDECPIGQADCAGQSRVLLRGDSDIRAMPNRNDSVFCVSGGFDVEDLPADVHDEEGLDIWKRMIARKLSKPGNVSPFVAIGAGVMPISLDGRIIGTAPSERFSTSYADPDSDMEACGKLGIGIDFFPAENLSFGLEGSYVFGFDDLNLDLSFLGDSEMDIVYFIFTFGAAYHF